MVNDANNIRNVSQCVYHLLCISYDGIRKKPSMQCRIWVSRILTIQNYAHSILDILGYDFATK